MHETIRKGPSYFRELLRREATIFRSIRSDVIDVRCFSARKFSLFPLPSQHENEFFFENDVARERFLKTPNFLPKVRHSLTLSPPFFRSPRSPVGEARCRFAHARTRTPTRTPASVAFVFAFTASPIHYKQLYSNTLGVKAWKVNAFTFPSRSARLPSRHYGDEKEKAAKR